MIFRLGRLVSGGAKGPGTYSSVCNRYIQYEQPMCMGFTRRAVVNHVQIGCKYCIVLKVQMYLNNHVNQLFW